MHVSLKNSLFCPRKGYNIIICCQQPSCFFCEVGSLILSQNKNKCQWIHYFPYKQLGFKNLFWSKFFGGNSNPCIDSYLLCNLNLTQRLKLLCILRCCCSKEENFIKTFQTLHLMVFMSSGKKKCNLLLSGNCKKWSICSVKRNKIKNFHKKEIHLCSEDSTIKLFMMDKLNDGFLHRMLIFCLFIYFFF